MANAFYLKGLEHFGRADINWISDTIRVALVTSAYTFDSAHEFFSSVSGVVTTADLASKTITNGIADADDVLIPSVSGSAVAALVIYKWTGAAGTSQLIRFFDTCRGIPVTPNGQDIKIVWPDDVNGRIFPLGR